MIKKLLIANRGEIALRIIRACKEMSIKTVAVYSLGDKSSLHVMLADEAVCIGGNRPKDSYLNMANILQAAISTGCDAIHPGFGFLSENPKFARLVKKCGLTFVGPSPEVIEKMGNKSEARKVMQKAKIPVVPGSKGEVKSAKEGLKIAQSIGYPVMIKAANGGGGKGMRVSYSEEDFVSLFEMAKAEAKANFGDEEMYIEKFIINPKHIEVQVMADRFGNVVHLFERDCSVQRRRQKMIEESPCMFLNSSTKEALYQAAIEACKAVKYDSVGTIEFLVDENQNFYFMEMNTRIQVEHPVSEMVTNIDIIKNQIRIASNLELLYKQEDIKIHNYALECRINAEDIDNDFIPSPGKINFVNIPGGKGVRVDSHIYSGYTIPPYYDSMILKLIVFAPTRLECIRKMRRCLEELIIEGIKTNIDYQYIILHSPQFISGNYSISFIDEFNKELSVNGKGISRKKK